MNGDLVSSHNASERPFSQNSAGEVSALALDWAQAAALASKQPLLSAVLDIQACQSPGPETDPGSSSEPGFSCSVCPLEGHAAGRRRVGTEAPAGGSGAQSVLASTAALAWPHPRSRFRGCKAHHTEATRVVVERTCLSGAGGC